MSLNLHVALFLLFCTSAVLAQSDDANGSEQYDVQHTPCKSVKGLEGECVPLERCTYSSDNIDMRMYRPKIYTDTCALPMMCCPKTYVHQPSSSMQPQMQATNDTWAI